MHIFKRKLYRATGSVLVILEKEALPRFGASVNKWCSPTAADESSSFPLVMLRSKEMPVWGQIIDHYWAQQNSRAGILKPLYISSPSAHVYLVVYSLNATLSCCQVERLYSLKRRVEERESYLFICCDVMRGESDTFVIYLDSFTVQQRPLYYVSLLSAS